MGVHAEATPLTSPLPGGTEGATVVVEPIVAGEVRQPSALMERVPGRLWKLKAYGRGEPRSQRPWVPVPAFLVRHPSVGAILIDTGLHPSIATDPSQNFGRLVQRVIEPRLEPGADVPTQLRGRGVGRVAVVVMTHLHIDHTSALSEFPDSIFVVSTREWRAATTGRRALRRGYRRRHFDFAYDFRTVDYDGDQIDSYGPFGRTFDLFGDGSVRLAYTPGHSAGHQSVILRLPRRDFVVAGDVIYTIGQLDGRTEQPLAADQHNWRRSLRELQLYRRDYPYAVIVPGHDAEFLANLDRRYAE